MIKGTDMNLHNTKKKSNHNFYAACGYFKSTFYLLTFIFLIPLLASCGGGGGSDGGTNQEPNNTVKTYNISGTISDLNGTLKFSLNNNSTQSFNTNGAFNFSVSLDSGENYQLVIATQPAGQTCGHNALSISRDNDAETNISGVTITCTNNVYTVGGSVSGLSGTLQINLNTGNTLDITGNGTFSFLTQVEYSSDYQVDIVSTPPGMQCNISNNSGVMPANDINNINIICSSNSTSLNPPVFEAGSNWINVQPVWKWTSGGGGNGTYRYEITSVNNCTLVDLSSTGKIINATQLSASETLADGTYRLCIQEQNDAGNWSDKSLRSYTIDTVAPYITEVTPKNLATDILTDPDITFNFSEYVPWDPTEKRNLLTLHDSAGNQIPGETTRGSNGFAFTPVERLQENETYTLTATQLFKDIAGNTLEQPYVWTFTTRRSLGLYPAAANWNDYVKNDGTDKFSASGAVCDGTETGRYGEACIHGGEMRSFIVTGQNSCSGLSVVDELNAFNWVCFDNTGEVNFVSSGLKKDVRLFNLLNGSQWKGNFITVSNTGGVIFTSAKEKWWNNSVEQIFTNRDTLSLNKEGTIYLIAPFRNLDLNITASKIALVVNPASTLTGYRNNSRVVSGNGDFLWIEGSFKTAGDISVLSMTSRFSVLRHLNISNSGGSFFGAGIELNNAHSNLIQNVKISLNQIGIWLRKSSYNTIKDGLVTMNSSNGIYIDDASNNNYLNNIMLTNNRTGLHIKSSNKNLALNITAAHNVTYGLNIESASSDNTVINMTAANNRNAGINIVGASNNNLFNHIAAVNNGTYGLNISASDDNSFQNLAATDNGPNNNLIIDQPPTYGIQMDQSSAYFTGKLIVGNNGDTAADNCVITGSTGLNNNCAAVGTSDHSLIQGASATVSFIGKVTSDTVNTSASSFGSAKFPPWNEVKTFDWITFDNNLRSWGASLDATRVITNGITFTGLTDIGKMGCNTHIFGVFDSANCYTWGNSWHNDGHIWDWNLKLSDNVIRNILPLYLNGGAINGVSHQWSDTTTITFLRNAIEIGGNANGLCESGERCLYTPNIGSYQGHKSKRTAGIFIDGDTLKNITLDEFSINGL